MKNLEPAGVARPKNIFHPSDFSAASAVAFAHALKFALLGKTQLSMLHVSPDPRGEDRCFPSVRDTLVRWGVLPEDCPKDAVAQLGIAVRKVVQKRDDPVLGLLAYLKKHPADLIVLARHPPKGGVPLLRRSVAEPLAHRSGRMTLFIPDGVPGFVSEKDGSISLKNILIPIARQPSPQAAVDAAARAVRNLKCADASFTLLHVGNETHFPTVGVHLEASRTWQRVVKRGEVVPTILAYAGECRADLIVMATDGRTGLLDALRGTTTEQVLRRAQCPLLAVPVDVEAR